MRKHRWLVAGGLFTLIGASVFAYWFDLLPLPEVEDGDYRMQPVSAIEECNRVGLGGMTFGQPVWWNAAPGKRVVWVAGNTNWKTVPDAEVKLYPKLNSSRALYGAIVFGKFQIKPGEGKPFRCVVDESAGTGKGYDRLYFDANGDLDLTNDPVLTPIKVESNTTAPTWTSTDFHPLIISFDFGPDFGEQPVQIQPVLTDSDGMKKHEIMLRLSASEARKGKIQIGRQRFNALMLQVQDITGRFDTPLTALNLTEAGLFASRTWWNSGGEDDLSSFRLVDGKLYTITTTPTGDTLKVRRYRGDVGTLRIEPGNRDISKMQMTGWLASKTASVPVGRKPQVSEPVQECLLPVGDYSVNEMQFRYGRLSFWVSQNYHAEGKYHGAEGHWSYSIKIRKDRPFVLDFSNRPEVMFLSPTKGQTLKAGEKIVVETVLADPVLGTMIRGMNDTSRKEKRKNGDGFVETDLSLAPTVKISDSAGKTLAEGVMPFG
jgi:hypothetical protein